MANGYTDVLQVVDEIKNDFVFGRDNEEGIKEFLSVKELAKRYNVSYSTLRQNHSKPEKWEEERKKAKEEITKQKLEKRAEEQAEKSLSIDEDYENIFKVTRTQAFEEMKAKKGKLRSSDYRNYSDTFLSCYEGEKYANGESLEQQNNNSGWDAFEKAFKLPNEEASKE